MRCSCAENEQTGFQACSYRARLTKSHTSQVTNSTLQVSLIAMKHIVDDVRIKEIKELSPPSHLVREFPVTEVAAETTYNARTAIHRILHGADDRLLVVVGPCSIHDVDTAMEYARKLKAETKRYEAE